MTEGICRVVPPPASVGAWVPAKDWDASWWATWLVRRGWSEAEVVNYLADRERLTFRVTTGKGKTQQVHVLYAPTPKGARFHLDARPNLLYGGAAGGAKSYTARWDAYLRLFAMPGCKLLLLRRKYTELMDNHLDDAQKECERMGKGGLGLPIRYSKDERRVYVDHPNAEHSWLRFGHCEHEGDEEQYLSSAYEAAYLDETATFTKRQAMAVQSRLRSVLAPTALFRCLSNPGGAHTLWLKQYFIDREVSIEEHEDYVPEEWGFIQSHLYDNPYYMDPDGTWTKYARRLKGYGPERARQMLDGDWDAIAGQYFHEWRADRHVADLGPVGVQTQWFRCLDWGYNARGACYWVACLPDGRLYVRHEYVFRETLAAEVAKSIRQQTKELWATATDATRLDGQVYTRYTAADPSMFNRTGQVGESHAETFARNGVPLQRANHDREIGWQRLRHWLAEAPDGRPWLVVHPSCRYLIRTLPALVADEQHPEDVDTSGDDHGADALRYGVMSRPMPSSRVADLRPLGEVGKLAQQARREARLRPRRRAA